jgi:adenylate cyclase
VRIGRQLGARYLVRGSLRRAGMRTRLTTELAEAETGSIVWARTIDVDDMLSFDSQDRVVGQVVNTLAPRVRDIELLRIRGKRPDRLSVYEKVLLARENILMLRQEPFHGQRDCLDEAVAEEPDYAEAYALAADWHSLMVGQVVIRSYIGCRGR